MPGTPIPNLFLGRKDTRADVWIWGEGPTDGAGPSQVPAGDDIVQLAKTARFFPAGFQGEAIFTQFWVGFTSDMDALTVQFTPIVDDVVYDGTGGNADLRQTVAIAEAVGIRRTFKFEFSLFLPFDDGADPDALRTALRGSWFQLLVDTVGGLGVGDFIIDAPEIEFEIVRESTAAE